ncbi:MAG TPA: type III-A CRISPR-associated protein Cas10/Csm1, partial [Melioribacteraceae bacterium]|nr:type III-A CRISPR-associated protein Cas10/Csm1 [Melioribacteraceae bacterium]
FLIIAADISGIQNFIYSEQSPVENSTKGLGKRLRGKSFYLSILTDTFAERFLELFGLTRANILINGGGHFVILVPNNEVNKNILKNEIKNIQSWFYKQYKGELNLIVESIEADEELYTNFNLWYNTISSRLQKAKKQRSFEAIDEIFNYDLDKFDITEYKDQINYEDDLVYKSLSSTYEKNLFGLSKLFENIGKIIPKSKYLIQINVSSDKKIKLGKDVFYIPFSKFNIYWAFVEKQKEIINLIDSLANESISAFRILKINDTDIYNFQINSNFPVTLGYRFIGTEVPKNGTNILEFEQIAELNYEATNTNKDLLKYPLLGTLRMDVDNLGSIFSNGLEKRQNRNNLKTLTRVVSLSRMFNLFFCGYLNVIAKKWGIYITYSGGDDLFVVGSWINSIGFAEELRTEFTRFVCNNNNITISGGLFVSKGNYPIGKAARYAGEAEEKAKHSFDDKDCISAFGKEFKWNSFNKYLLYGKELEQLVISKNPDENVNRSFIHRILQITNEIYEDPTKINIKYFEKIALIKYLFAKAPRKIDNNKIQLLKTDPNKANKKIKLLGKLILEDSQEYLKNFIIPATYIILKHRNSKQ